MIHVKDWLNKNSKLLEQLSNNPGKYLEETFFRNPNRSYFIDDHLFLSPADGTILYAEEVEPDESILDVKGKDLTVKELLQDNSYNQRSLVISIFLSVLDVHIIRAPLGSLIVSIEDKEPLRTRNLSMTLLENDLFQFINPLRNKKNLEFDFYNERVVISLLEPNLGLRYKIVEIADKEVDSILFFADENEVIDQGERLAWVVWGSEVIVVVPLNQKYEYELIAKPMYHVEAAKDVLFKIKEKKK